jgi:8-oxo-dGTP pyrophosphatase MutT (NUDIX family)
MIFEHIIGINKEKETIRINNRKAIRAVIIREGQLLMISNKKGDIKFPGGGLEVNESHEEAVKREVQEETGYIVTDVGDLIGTVIERRDDKFEKKCIFEMKSFYYSCRVSNEKTEQSLDDYEAALEYEPKWIDLEKAITINSKVLKEGAENPWVTREFYVLEQLISNIS